MTFVLFLDYLMKLTTLLLSRTREYSWLDNYSSSSFLRIWLHFKKSLVSNCSVLELAKKAL